MVKDGKEKVQNFLIYLVIQDMKENIKMEKKMEKVKNILMKEKLNLKEIIQMEKEMEKALNILEME